MASKGKKSKIVDGPSKWNLMLALFDYLPHPDAASRFVSFVYIGTDGRRGSFWMVVTSVVRKRDPDEDPLGWPGELWSIGGYICGSSSRIVHVVDYSVEKRSGWTDFA